MKTSKILALILALCMVLSVGALASGEPSAETADTGALTAEEAYVEYIHEWLLNELENNSSLTIDQIENEFMPLVEAGNYTEFPAEMLYGGMLNTGVAMTFEEFAAQYVPAAAAGTVSAEDAYVEYIHEFLLNELENNSNMTIEQIEDEFMPLIEAGNYTEFPAEMLYGGMLNTGIAMTFEEFAAQYVPAAGAATDGYTADEAGYKAYLKDWVAANPAVQANIDEFNTAIEAGSYADFPLEMCFTDQWFGFAALTLDEFVAAGGAAEIPAFDPTLTAD